MYKYVVVMNKTRQYSQGEYGFNTKDEVWKFLESLNPYELDQVTDIQKYNRKSWKCVYSEFFE